MDPLPSLHICLTPVQHATIKRQPRPQGRRQRHHGLVASDASGEGSVGAGEEAGTAKAGGHLLGAELWHILPSGTMAILPKFMSFIVI